MKQDTIRRESFVMYREWYEALQYYPAEMKWKILDAAIRYALYGEEPTEQNVLFAFNMMRGKLDEDTAKYMRVVERNRNNGANGGRPRKTESTETQNNPKIPNNPSNPNNPKNLDIVSDIDIVSEEEKKNNIFTRADARSVFEYWNNQAKKENLYRRQVNTSQKRINALYSLSDTVALIIGTTDRAKVLRAMKYALKSLLNENGGTSTKKAYFDYVTEKRYFELYCKNVINLANIKLD